MKKRIILPVVILVIVIAGTLVAFSSNNPIVYHKFINSVKYDVISFFAPHELTVTSNIALAPGGDVNKNGKIDAGDSIRFTYVIKNTTDKTYKFVTLVPNVNRQDLNFIHNITGSTGLLDDGKTISFSNIWIEPNQIQTISFEARTDFFQDTNKKITTTPEIFDQNHITITKSQQVIANATGISQEKLKSLFKGNNI